MMSYYTHLLYMISTYILCHVLCKDLGLKRLTMSSRKLRALKGPDVCPLRDLHNWFFANVLDVPSGNDSHSYGKTLFLMEKKTHFFTISMDSFHSCVSHYQLVGEWRVLSAHSPQCHAVRCSETASQLIF